MKIALGLFYAAIIILAFAAGFQYGQKSSPVPQGLDTVTEAWNLILDNYVDESRLDTANMSRSAVDSITALLEKAGDKVY